MDKYDINYKILKRDFWIVNLASGVGVLMLLLYLLLQRVGVLPSMPCMFHDLFHMYCPGCGGTRATAELLKGHILASLWYNPSVLVGALLVLYYELGVIVTLLKKNGKRYYIASGWPAYIFVIWLFVFSIARNVLLVGFKVDMIHDFLP